MVERNIIYSLNAEKVLKSREINSGKIGLLCFDKKVDIINNQGSNQFTYNNPEPLYIGMPIGLTHEACFSILPLQKKELFSQRDGMRGDIR